jgi:hypothetical protein
MRNFDQFDQFDEIIYLIFDFEIKQVVEKCEKLFENNLFSAHLLNILYLNGKLQLNKHEMTTVASEHPSEMAEMSLTRTHELNLSEYGQQLLKFAWSSCSLSLYQTAFDYLVKCKKPSQHENYGIHLIEMNLERYPLTDITETDANRLFHMAAYEYGLHDLAFSIGRVLQKRAFDRGMYGTALSWNVRIKDPAFGTIIADKYFLFLVFYMVRDLYSQNLKKKDFGSLFSGK